MILKNLMYYYFFHSGIYPKIDWFLGFHFEKKDFKKGNGYGLNLKKTVTFNEKVIRKKLFDRNPLLYQTADKKNVKTLLREKMGNEFADNHIIPTLFAGNDLEKIPFSSLPPEFIIKGCHLSGYNLIITKNKKLTKETILSHCRLLLKLDMSTYTHEWLYGKIPKNIIIEPLIRDENGNIPQDHKFFCFWGRVKMFHVDFGRYNFMKRSLFDRNGNYIDGTINYPKGENRHGIENFDEIIAFVESLCFGLDFVRVDIYIIKNKPVFGEFTHYPGGGWSKITPFELDTKLGSFWELKSGDRNKK